MINSASLEGRLQTGTSAKYVISDRPLTEEEWIRQHRATLIARSALVERGRQTIAHLGKGQYTDRCAQSETAATRDSDPQQGAA